ncbi:hypothetical protein ACLMJK_001434 [Lecanora helva]
MITQMLPLLEPTFLSSVSRSPFECSYCRRRLSLLPRNGRKQVSRSRIPKAQHRHASTVPSITAVNAKHEIPASLQNLHASLKALGKNAGIYVNTSQLQLALRGLESEDPITRVAILGVNGQTGARRLARALLADPLASEQQWESELLKNGEIDEKAILLRLEIFIHTSNPISTLNQEDAVNLLVPGLETPTPGTGRLSAMTYPVHKTLVYNEGLNGLGTLAAIESSSAQVKKEQMLKGAIDWSWSIMQQQPGEDYSTSPINLALAEAALDTFRKSLDKSLEYEHLWFDAGIPALSSWLLDGTVSSPKHLKLNVERLLETICENAEQGIQQETAKQLHRERDAAVSLATRNIIAQGISIWADNAHAELRDRLNSAFNSKNWKKTKWWKLLWRVDDVGYVTADILQQAWLVEAEKEMIWLTGRIHQSGLLGQPKLRPAAVVSPEDEEHKVGGNPPAPTAADLVPEDSNYDDPPVTQHPWPQQIARARSSLAKLTVPPLQALSQGLLVQTLSTNILASAFSVLLYVSISTTSPFEAGAVAAAGLIYSLQRLQRRWETARAEWEIEIREEGRRILRLTENIARQPVDEYKPDCDEMGVEERAVAAKAIADVQNALRTLRH